MTDRVHMNDRIMSTLNTEMICREALKQMHEIAKEKNLSFVLAQGIGKIQSHVDFRVYDDELNINIDDFSGRYIKPAVACLVEMNDGLIIKNYKLPEMAGAKNSTSLSIDGLFLTVSLASNFDYDTDSTITIARIEILHD